MFNKMMFSLFSTVVSVVLVGCGGNSSLNQSAMPQWNTLPTNTRAAYPIPQTLTSGTAQAVPGGQAVATANGYVYEQAPVASGYNYYNTQNPCLYPKPGQQLNCGSGSYYAQMPQAATTGYPTQNAYTANTSVNPYNSGQTGYSSAPTSAYPQAYPAAPAVNNPYVSSHSPVGSAASVGVSSQSAASRAARSRIAPEGYTSTGGTNKKGLSF